MRSQLVVILTGMMIVTAVALTAQPAVPSTPAAIQSLLVARPFTLDEGFRFDWRLERPVVAEGYLLVLEVNPDLVYPRQTAQPVLFVDDQTAMRLNVGYGSGRVIAIVPGIGQPGRIWFGTPQLPEAVNAGTIATERMLATNEGVGAISAQELLAARARGGQPLRLSNLNQLLKEAAGLIVQYAADERALANILATQGS